mmetsp:Transcript_14749/g.39109  ORF Transcript_14749/g.39109 Transcript_14749/m.39109 type:complete len:201 (-) Transcript_14749:105-707(-)
MLYCATSAFSCSFGGRASMMCRTPSMLLETNQLAGKRPTKGRAPVCASVPTSCWAVATSVRAITPSLCRRPLSGEEREAVERLSHCGRFLPSDKRARPALRSRCARRTVMSELTSTTMRLWRAARKVPARASSWAAVAIAANQLVSWPTVPSSGFDTSFMVSFRTRSTQSRIIAMNGVSSRKAKIIWIWRCRSSDLRLWG